MSAVVLDRYCESMSRTAASRARSASTLRDTFIFGRRFGAKRLPTSVFKPEGTRAEHRKKMDFTGKRQVVFNLPV